MAAGTTASAAVIHYYVWNRRLGAKGGGEEEEDGLTKSSRSLKRRIARRPAQAPATWFEALVIRDVEGNLQVASLYAGNNSVELKGPEIISELNSFLRLLTLCILFSKKPFPVFLASAGYSEDDVLLQKAEAQSRGSFLYEEFSCEHVELLKPAFTIIHDNSSKCFLLLICGTQSIKDTLTAATGAVVPFHHSVLHDGGIGNLVLGYAHRGMVAAARWIAKLSAPCLLEALGEYCDYKIKIVGHSLGGGTAGLLTDILCEQKEFSSSACVTFAPAACMTWDLAESGKHFITTIINGSDLVPTVSATSVDDLHSEVQQTRFLSVVFHSTTALGSSLPSIASAKARVAGAGALLCPVSSTTKVVMKGAQNVTQAVVRSHSTLSACMGPCRHNVVPALNSKEEDLPEASVITGRNNSHRGLGPDDTDEDEPLIAENGVMTTTTMDEITEGELWYELEKELERQKSEVDLQAPRQKKQQRQKK
ncbi:hypothetical protein SLEP1_g58040 [Rubroshorea leprosula]|uniref:Fungal lipase-type domain-containing protein n=1 Tax=Rubroshorea leprosula TaxID=152421 RepID=A0AAV5MP99_9ROSI|nr:hypothetical protein SLEP1_g58040 [Rubroshorea leprosula]